MGELWCTRRWRKLLNLIDRLPGSSLYAEAVAQDDEAAAAYLQATEGMEPASAKPRLSEFNPVVQALAQVVDRLALVEAAVIAAAGGSPARRPPFPRPEVASDRVRRQMASRKHRRLVSILLPSSSQNEPEAR